MNLATAKTIIQNWDKPLIRHIFWYLVIPAHVELQRAAPLTYAYRNAQHIPYRLIYFIQFLLAIGAFAMSDLLTESSLVLAVKIASAYCSVMYGVWTLAYWSMRRPKAT